MLQPRLLGDVVSAAHTTPHHLPQPYYMHVYVAVAIMLGMYALCRLEQLPPIDVLAKVFP